MQNKKYFAAGLILVALDALTKFAAIKYFQNPYVLVRDFLQFHLSFNPGVAFSIPLPNWLIITLTPIVLFIAWKFFVKEHFKNKASLWIFVLIFSGAIGNLIDRIFRSAVVDFIDFSFWPSFNLADSCITLALFLLLLQYDRIK